VKLDEATLQELGQAVRAATQATSE
jgi:hypothetical protein